MNVREKEAFAMKVKQLVTEDKEDLTCLGDGLVFEVGYDKTGINGNELIVGATGCGKTFSVDLPKMLHTNNRSIVVILSKLDLVRKTSAYLKDKNYDVIHMDFVNLENNTVGYNPLEYVKNEEDVQRLASILIGEDPESKGNSDRPDPFWINNARQMIAAVIHLVMLNAKYAKKKAYFADVLTMLKSIMLKESENGNFTNLDTFFSNAEKFHPGNPASCIWKGFAELSSKTFSCVIAEVTGAVGKMFSESVIAMSKMENSISFKQLGEKKTALLITTSPMSSVQQNYINLMYADMFKELFEAAEKKVSGCLDVPVHIICDDFACSGKIHEFQKYISIFRAAGISVSILLQSESQLKAMYGEHAAVTIINNCDTYLYMGGMDVDTCHNIARRINKPVHEILSLPLERVILFRRGSKPVTARRYQTLEDPMYKKMMEMNQNVAQIIQKELEEDLSEDSKKEFKEEVMADLRNEENQVACKRIDTRMELEKYLKKYEKYKKERDQLLNSERSELDMDQGKDDSHEASDVILNDLEMLVLARDYSLIEQILEKTSYEFVEENDYGRRYRTDNILDSLVVSRQLQFSKDTHKYDDLIYIYARMDNKNVDIIEKSKMK